MLNVNIIRGKIGLDILISQHTQKSILSEFQINNKVNRIIKFRP